jgi:uncharacterized membrane protein YdjX (TVP38/TMEM64 family)
MSLGTQLRVTTPPARALIFGVIVAVVALVASLGALHDVLLRVLAEAQSVIAQHPVLGALLFVILAAISAMLAFVSSAVLVPVAVYVWGAALCAALLWGGWILGGLCAYGIGRWLGQSVVARLTSRQTLAHYQDRLSKRAPFGLVLLFQLALPSEIPGYVLGMANYPLARYLLALAIAELPYVMGTVFLGTSLLQRRMPLLLSVGAASILLSLWAWRSLQQRLASSRRAGDLR